MVGTFLAGNAPDAGAEDPRDRAPDLPFRFLLRPPLHDKRVAAYSGYPVRLNWIYHGDPFVWLTPDDLRTRSVVLHTLGFNHGAYRDQLSLPGAEGALADLMEYGWQARHGYALLAQRTRWPWARLDFHYSYTPWGYPLMWLCHLFDETWCRYDARIRVPDPYVSWAQKHAFMIQLVNQLSPDFIGLMYSRYRHTPEEELPWKGNPEQQSDFFFEVLCEVTQQDRDCFSATGRYRSVAMPMQGWPPWAMRSPAGPTSFPNSDAASLAGVWSVGARPRHRERGTVPGVFSNGATDTVLAGIVFWMIVAVISSA